MSWSEELANQVGCSKGNVYRVAKLLGRRPTVEDMRKSGEKKGRPLKYVETTANEKGDK